MSCITFCAAVEKPHVVLPKIKALPRSALPIQSLAAAGSEGCLVVLKLVVLKKEKEDVRVERVVGRSR